MGTVEILVEWVTLAAREFIFWGGVLFLIAGMFTAYQGWQQRKLHRIATDTPLTEISDVTEPGCVHIRGEITTQAPRDPFTAPITGDDDAVLEAWELKETYETPKRERTEKSAWGVNTAPFYITDGTGDILVDIDDLVMGERGSSDREFVSSEALHAVNGVAGNGVHCEFETFDTQVEIEYDEEPPTRIQDFVRRTSGLSRDPMVTDIGEYVVEDSKRAYRGETLQVGDEVSLIGHVGLRHGISTGQDFEVRHGDDADTAVYVSAQDFRERGTGTGLFLFAGLTVCVGTALLAARFVL